jgi:hypothetical protein
VLQTNATVFGEQLGKGTDPSDQGGFAYGGRSTNNPEDYIALPPEWSKLVPPGYAMPIWNPDNPDKVVWGVHRDKGPANWRQDEGVGMDVAPSVAQQLGIKGNGTVQFDPTKAKPMSVEEARGALAEASQPSRLTASTGAGGAMPSGVAESKDPIKRYKDGTLDYGGGTVQYPDGTIHTQHGNQLTIYTPDNSSPNGYRMKQVSVKPQDKPVPPIPEGMDAETALKQLPPEDQEKVNMFANYHAPIMSVQGKWNPDFNRLISYIKKVNPDIDAATYQKRRQTMLQYADQSPTKPGGNISSANQSAMHLGTLIGFYNELGNKKFPDANKALNYLKTKMGAEAVTNFDGMVEVLATEVARSLQKGAPSLTQIDEWKNKINASMGNEQLRGQLMKIIPEALGGQLKALNGGYKKSMGKDLPLDDLIYEDTRKSLLAAGIKNFGGRKLSDDKSEAKAEAPAVPALQEGKVYPFPDSKPRVYHKVTDNPKDPQNWTIIQQ